MPVPDVHLLEQCIKIYIEQAPLDVVMAVFDGHDEFCAESGDSLDKVTPEQAAEWRQATTNYVGWSMYQAAKKRATALK
jgi:hypothetical protein